jgi:methyl-accepting chemotaxis protein
MEEVAQSGVQISDRAKQVAGSAEAASAASRAGLQAVESTNRTMENIRVQAEAVAENVVSLSEKTQAIGEIIATVNDIAEQSHLLR